MQTTIRIFLPLSDDDLDTLAAGDHVMLNGDVYTARDAAHKKLIETLQRGESLPVNLDGALIFYAGPTPPPPGKVIGAVGPTSAYRMDGYAIELMQKVPVKGSIGKGHRSVEFKEACRKYKNIYFAATGGIAALLHEHVLASETIAYPELGTEAIRKLTVKDLPVVVINDIFGGELETGGKVTVFTETE